LYTALVDGGCAEGVTAGWVTADSASGRDGRFRAFLQAHRMPYVVEVPVRHTITMAAVESIPCAARTAIGIRAARRRWTIVTRVDDMADVETCWRGLA
jgi:SRSO17 transposase